ncbi:UDP-glucuronic acid decarboxylase family protein [Arcobacter sp.]|uniref:UDP-glucuronic acid decarboxylase family protein n=1 Tax=Arcobacter sp. TaxID=1872629 RepID=UPI003D0DE062
MSRILVTGGAGFVGNHLCRKLLKEGHEVLCLDNFFTGSKNNILDLLGNSYFELIRHDIQTPILLEVDEIYNLACPASPESYQYDPVATTRTSVLGAINVLDIAKKCNAKVLQASTSEIYGDPKVHPQTEDYRGNVNTIGIRACYDEGKRCAETLFFDYKRQYDINIKIIRIFNTYGPYMSINDGRVISNFIVQALQNKDITIYGEGNQTRSFQYIDDLIDAMIITMSKDKEFSGPVNIGNPIEFSILDIAKKIIKLTNSSSKLIFLPLPADDPTQRQPNIDLAKKELNWEPKIMLDDGLKKTIDYFKRII